MSFQQGGTYSKREQVGKRGGVYAAEATRRGSITKIWVEEPDSMSNKWDEKGVYTQPEEGLFMNNR